jgi:hypothetical protein
VKLDVSVGLSKGAQDNIWTNLEVIKGGPPFTVSEQQGTEPAWVQGPHFLKEKKQTLDHAPFIGLR